jgi:hypothetical protein
MLIEKAIEFLRKVPPFQFLDKATLQEYHGQVNCAGAGFAVGDSLFLNYFIPVLIS